MSGAVVVKVGGSELARAGFSQAFARAISELKAMQPCVVVHGGGPEINQLLESQGISPRYHEGQRVTDEATLAVVEMALSGRVNKEVVRSLLTAGLDALGLSGVDRRLLTVEPLDPAMGRVGRVATVRESVLRTLLVEGVVPVVSPVSLGPGGAYNVNADHAAAAIAAALGADRLVFLTNVPGVRIGDRFASRLTSEEIDAFLTDGTIHGGMIPKVRAGLEAAEAGVSQVSICELEGLLVGGGTTLFGARTEHHAPVI